MQYCVVIHKDQDSDFGVTVPDLPGCFSAGKSYDEALLLVKEAIECHIEGLLIDNQPIPMSTSIDNWINHKEFCDGIWALVDIDLSQISGRARRINITIPEKILKIIDLYTKNHSIKNRSSFLADAALNYIQSHK